MTALKDRFWAKVLFSQFIKHYRKMTPEQKVADIDASMDALEELDDSGGSFGAKMVRWSMERVEQYPMARENGKKGGRPRKDSSSQEDARESEQREGDTGPVDSMGRTDAPSRTLPLPTWEDFLSFVDGEGLDYTDAREWWEMTMVDRKGHDRNGKRIDNWKGALKRFCTTKTANRRTA